MSREVRVQAEGSFSLVQASGVGTAWSTGATPPSARDIAFVDSFSVTSAQQLVTQKERGRPHHHKIAGQEPIDVQLTCRWTGGAFTALSSSGATVPMYHGEWKVAAPEMGAGTARYMQFYGIAWDSVKYTENAEADTVDIQFRALGMNGPTASGYLS